MLPTLPLSEVMTAAEARSRLEADGWRMVGAGDWSWVLADPSDAWAARITPFDPGYRMFAEACLDGPANPWLPDMWRVIPLVRDGYVVLMERLWPAEEGVASAFCAALGIPNDTGYEAPVAGPAVIADEPEIQALRSRIQVLLAEGRRRHPLWAVCDIREGNIMANRAGRLKLVDPMGIAGWKIVETVRAGRAERLADFSRRQLEDFLTIPYFGPGREGLADRDELLALVARLKPDARETGQPSR
jgi:hypothetical protein